MTHGFHIKHHYCFRSFLAASFDSVLHTCFYIWSEYEGVGVCVPLYQGYIGQTLICYQCWTKTRGLFPNIFKMTLCFVIVGGLWKDLGYCNTLSLVPNSHYPAVDNEQTDVSLSTIILTQLIPHFTAAHDKMDLFQPITTEVWSRNKS